MRALVVDDSLTVRMDLSEALAAEGLDVVSRASLADGHAALSEGAPFDLVLLDVVLPDGDGVTLLEELRSRPEHARTIVMLLSTEVEVRDRVRGLARGADEYLGKPYDVSFVVARAKELLRKGGAMCADDRPLLLVIDDSVTFRAQLTAALAAAQYRVAEAETGEAGLRLAATNRPAAIIVDGMLPDTSGAEIVRRLRLDAALRSIPCLMLTGSTGSGAEVQALEAGADDFVRKTDDLNVVLARLEVLLRNRGQEVAALETESLAAPKKVLAVDDSATYLQETVDALAGSGFEVITARSGIEALELLAVQKVDCILLDVEMVGMNGREVCRRVKANPTTRDTPLILVTADASREAMSAGLSAGADDFVVKSSELQVLRARVLAQLRRKQLEDQRRHVREALVRRELEAAEAKAARELAEAKAELVLELERKNKELEAFSYSVSHDLRAPLRGIMGFMRALIEDSGHLLDATGREHADRVEAAAIRMNQLIDDLLALSRIGRSELRRTKTDVTGLVRVVVQELKNREPNRQVEVEIEEGLEASADAQLLRVLFENVLGNAWKFTGKVAAPRITVRREDTPHGRAIVVRDNGAGFDAKHANKLFTPFQRLHRADEFPGTGIGLATVHRVAERHGGKVWAESEVGKGTAILFTLEQT
ncbi:MAG: response regulator [Myxococcaceae bacterium]|nr:response regulator [Myxococcaceae bacterium]